MRTDRHARTHSHARTHETDIQTDRQLTRHTDIWAGPWAQSDQRLCCSTAAVLCPWARHFTPRKYWLITQEAMAPSRHDWKIVDWDVKPQHNQPTFVVRCLDSNISRFYSRNFKTLASFCGCAHRFVSGLVGNSRKHIFSCRGSYIHTDDRSNNSDIGSKN